MHPAPLLLLAALVGFGHAQEETVTTELLTLSFNASSPGYYYRNGKEVMKLDASRQGIGAPILYRGPRLLSLYRNEADLEKPKEGEEPPKPILQTRLPQDTDRVLLLFAYPKGKDKDALPQLRAIGIATQDMKEGDYRVFNMTSQTVYAVMNDEKATLPAGKPVDITSGPWRSKALDMDVQFGLREAGKIRPVYASIWGHRPVRRTFLFIFDRPDKHRPLDLRMFYDVPSVRAAGSGESPPSE